MSVDPGAYIRRYDLSFALSLPRRALGNAEQATRYAAAQGIVFALLRHQDPAASRALHDANQRKALSASPVRIQPLSGDLARATLRLGVWQPELAALLDEALRSSSDLAVDIAGRPALLLSWTLIDAFSPAELFAAPAPSLVRVRFVTPTFFGFGRHPSGAARLQVVPDAGLVVSSWLRAWRLTGEHTLDWLPTAPESLGQSIALMEMRRVRTEGVVERGIPLSGFLGECGYRWEGAEPEGCRALAVLARFAEVCGTGAKTGRGFGQTEPVGLSAPSCGHDGTGAS